MIVARDGDVCGENGHLKIIQCTAHAVKLSTLIHRNSMSVHLTAPGFIQGVNKKTELPS